jgi:hypothetical protein
MVAYDTFGNATKKRALKVLTTNPDARILGKLKTEYTAVNARRIGSGSRRCIFVANGDDRISNEDQ